MSPESWVRSAPLARSQMRSESSSGPAAEMAAVPSGVNATVMMSLLSPCPVKRVTGWPRTMSQTRTAPSP